MEHPDTAPDEILASDRHSAGWLHGGQEPPAFVDLHHFPDHLRATHGGQDERTDAAGQDRPIRGVAVYDRLAQMYSRMGPEDIRAENEANFAVDRASVKHVKVKTTGGPEGGVGSDVLIIKAAKTYKVTLGRSKAAGLT